jgi:hypothetical protein
MNESLTAKVKQALIQIEPMAVQNWPPAQSIARQLNWCLALANNESREPMPGPLTMGLIATREFDMYGDNPELAQLINEVQYEANKLLA